MNMSEPSTQPPNPADKNGQTPPSPPAEQPRDTKGKFQPKPSAPIAPTPPAEAPAPTSPPEKDELLDEIEKELTVALKGSFNPKDLETLDQRMRIKMLRILAKVDSNKRAPIVDPTQPEPVIDKPMPTLAEINRADQFRADMRKQDSYLSTSQKLRGISK
jgi:hypothetical protein